MSVFDDYDFVVTPSSSKQQFWVPTGEGNRVRPQRVTYESLTVEVFPVGSPRVKEARLGGVSGTAAFTEGTRDRLRDASCERNFQTLASRHPDLRGVISVGSSFLPEALRGKGMGLAAYRLLVEHAGKMGLAVVPHYCDTGTPLTSADALRVWDKLAQVPGFDAEGHVVYAPPVKANPVVPLSRFADDKNIRRLKESIWKLAPGGVHGGEYAFGRGVRDQWALGLLRERGVVTSPALELGRGVTATAYEIAGGKVLKVTSDPLDAAVLAEVAADPRVASVPGIPHVEAVYYLGKVPPTAVALPGADPPHTGGNVYAIVMERLYPLDDSEKAELLINATSFHRGWLTTPMEVASELRTTRKGSVSEAWLRAVLFLWRHGFHPSDLHSGNMMKRADGTYVVSDFGLSFPVKGARTASRDIPRPPINRSRAKAERAAKKAIAKMSPDELFAALQADGFQANPRRTRRARTAPPVLDPRHAALVATPAFKRWFRDSKVVSESGEPLVVYHGSPDIRHVFGGMTTFRSPPAFFATDVYGVANTYTPKGVLDYQNSEPGVIPLFVSMQNPMVIDAKGARFRKTENYVHQAYRDGHDGIIILNSVDDYLGSGGMGLATVYAWFDPRQAKSAVLDELRSRIDGKALSFAMPNSGNFDPTNPDIRMNPRAPRSLPRMASLFSGGGLVEAGLTGLVEPVFAVDCDAHVASVYEAAHGAHICVADVCDVALPQRGTVDYLHASPVCKTSSLAKRGRKEESTDVKTAQATADAIRALLPEIFTLENVPGYQKSASFGLITDALREEGYTFDARVYDAADYGAPTHRTRLLLRAVREGELPPVPKPTHPVGGQADWYASVTDIIEAMPDTALPKARKRAEDWMSLRLRAAGVDLSRLPRPLLVLGGSTGRGIPHAFAGGPAPTLKATTGEAHRIFLPDGRVKRLTPRGMARITGLPDDYPLPSAWGLAVTVIGNGVPPALARAIFGPLLQPARQKRGSK